MSSEIMPQELVDAAVTRQSVLEELAAERVKQIGWQLAVRESAAKLVRVEAQVALLVEQAEGVFTLRPMRDRGDGGAGGGAGAGAGGGADGGARSGRGSRT